MPKKSNEKKGGGMKGAYAFAKKTAKGADKSLGGFGSAAVKRATSATQLAADALQEKFKKQTMIDQILKEVSENDDVKMKELILQAFTAVLDGKDQDATSIHDEMKARAKETVALLSRATLTAQRKYKGETEGDPQGDNAERKARWMLMETAITKEVADEVKTQPFISKRVHEACVSSKKRAVSESSELFKAKVDAGVAAVVSLKFV
jgi:hypothetical protein